MLDESRTQTTEINPELLEALLEATREQLAEERFAAELTALNVSG